MRGKTVLPHDKAAPGTHLCAFHSGPAERDALLVDFLRVGLRAGDMCVCLLDRVEPQDVLGRLMATGDVGPCAGSEQLQIGIASSVYLRSGRFSVGSMTSFLTKAAAAAADIRFPRVRVVSEMSWVLPGPPRAKDFVDYECAISRVVDETAAVLMFLYDVDQLGTPLLVDVLKTHAQVPLGATVLDNPHPQTPTQYLSSQHSLTPAHLGSGSGLHERTRRTEPPHSELNNHTLATVRPDPRPKDPGHDRWGSLTGAERRITDLVSTGLTNRVIAEQLTLSSHTVDAHLKHVYTKLDIHSRVELTVVALRHMAAVEEGRRAAP